MLICLRCYVSIGLQFGGFALIWLRDGGFGGLSLLVVVCIAVCLAVCC